MIEYPCRYVANYDGDTVTVRFEYSYDPNLRRWEVLQRNVRLVGLNTPELDDYLPSVRTEAIKAKGDLAAWFTTTTDTAYEWPHLFIFDGKRDDRDRWFGDISPFGDDQPVQTVVAYMLGLGWPPYVGDAKT